MEVLRRAQYDSPLEDLQPVLSLEELLQLQSEVKKVLVDDTIKAYIIELANRTRNDDWIYLGVSPRASIALMKASQAYAFLNGRDYVLPDDVQYLVPFVFAHRLILKSEARYEEMNSEFIIREIISTTPVPVKRAVLMMQKVKIFTKGIYPFILLIATFVFAMFQGGFVSWFLFYTFLPFALYSFVLFFYPLTSIRS